MSEQRTSRTDLTLLSQLLRRRTDGKRACVPVFGTGLNLQAASIEGYKDRDDWSSLLNKIAARIGMSRDKVAQLPTTYLALWEAMLCACAEKMSVYPYQAEGQLQMLVSEELKRQEEECRGFRLYRDIANAGFEDIISLNFDRRIALSSKSNKFVSAPTPCPLGSHGESLFRHSVVPNPGSVNTRIWYPHGDVKKAATIKLGVRKYGFYIGIFREYLHRLGNAWRYKPNSAQQKSEGAKSSWPMELPAWLDLALGRPLVFVGCGLSADEWPLWWLLRTRGSKRAPAPPTLCLTVARSGSSSPPHFNLLPDMRVISFESPQELWETFLADFPRNPSS